MLKLILQLIVCWPDKFRDADINVEGLKVFAVERKGRNTVIGYHDESGKVKCYYLDCSLAKHQDIVNRFRAKTKST
jgi:hypothetical protein